MALGVSLLPEALAAVLTGEVTLLQMNVGQVAARAGSGGQDGAAQATHQLTVGGGGERVLHAHSCTLGGGGERVLHAHSRTIRRLQKQGTGVLQQRLVDAGSE